jgi:hypothetical protein
MKRVVLLITIAGVFVGLFAGSSAASWVSANCFDDDALTPAITRSSARTYAEVAAREGYEWGGGCWNDNNRDDTPGAPDSGGEGPDCSGLVFKSWELRLTWGLEGFRWWNKFENVHGYYSSNTFHAPTSDLPFFKLANKLRSTTLFMDAFAKNGHVGLIDTSIVPSGGGDYIMEAKGDVSGTGIFIEDYRGNSNYVATRREGWAVEQCTWFCPQVAATDGTIVVP